MEEHQGESLVACACYGQAPVAALNREGDLTHRCLSQSSPLDLVGNRGAVDRNNLVTLHQLAGGGATVMDVGHDHLGGLVSLQAHAEILDCNPEACRGLGLVDCATAREAKR